LDSLAKVTYSVFINLLGIYKYPQASFIDKASLKGRFTIDKKYIGKDIYIAFIEEEKIKIYNHDKAVSIIPDNIKDSDSWSKYGGYSWGKTPKFYDNVIKVI